MAVSAAPALKISIILNKVKSPIKSPRRFNHEISGKRHKNVSHNPLLATLGGPARRLPLTRAYTRDILFVETIARLWNTLPFKMIDRIEICEAVKLPLNRVTRYRPPPSYCAGFIKSIEILK